MVQINATPEELNVEFVFVCVSAVRESDQNLNDYAIQELSAICEKQDGNGEDVANGCSERGCLLR